MPCAIICHEPFWGHLARHQGADLGLRCRLIRALEGLNFYKVVMSEPKKDTESRVTSSIKGLASRKSVGTGGAKATSKAISKGAATETPMVAAKMTSKIAIQELGLDAGQVRTKNTSGKPNSMPAHNSQPVSKPRSGGPRTETGKQISSMNATRHGLTSTRALPDEIEMVEAFTQELIDYYKPESPLEVMQIQRIAFCRAKLAKLADIEIAGRELARRQIDRHPERIMEQLVGYPQRAKFIALQLIKGEPYLQRLHLSEDKLREIGIEIQNVLGTIESRDMFERAFPKLCAFLMSVKLTDNEPEDMQPDSKLTLLVERIEKVFKEEPDDEEKITEVDRMLRAINADEKIDSQILAAGARTPWQGEYVMTIRKCLNELHNVWQMYRYAQQVIESYHDYKNWNVRALDLTAQDSDRLMKYQSMLDKRLSTAVGELLELQRRRTTL